MASCYLCAAHIPTGEGYRREVMTSHSTRIYASRRGGGSYSQTHGLRTLCATCAASLDRRREGQGSRVLLSLIAAIIGCITAIKARDAVDGGLASLIFAFFLFGGAGIIVFIVLSMLHGAKVKDQESAKVREWERPYELPSDVQPATALTKPERIATTEPHPGITRAAELLHTRLKEIGVSLTGCYGYPSTNDGARQLIALLNDAYPPRHFPTLEAWGNTMFRRTIARVSKDAIELLKVAGEAQQEGGNDAFVAAFKPMFAAFPMQHNEEFQPYLDRLGAALAHAGRLIDAEKA